MAASDAAEGLELTLAILNGLPDPALLIDSARQLIALNDAAKCVLPGPPAIDRDLALSMRHPEVLDAVGAVLAGAAPMRLTVSFPLPVHRVFEVHAAALPSYAGGAAAVLTLHDISAALAAARMRTDFVANVSHELRSPLSSLIGFIETLQGAAQDDAASRGRFLGTMQGEAQRMARLIDDLLSLSKVEAEEHVQPPGEVDLAPLLASVTTALKPRAAEAALELVLDCTEEVGPVQGDRDELAEVFHNLVDNAIKYGRGGNEVQVTLEPVDRIPDVGSAGFCVCVRDQGEGIGSEHLPRLTERFYRVDTGRSRNLGGTGLGLAIVKHIVNRHRGRLVIESESGEGGTFKVYLPVRAETDGTSS